MIDPTPFNTAPAGHEAGMAIWRRLEIQLADEIRKGRLGDEGRLPTEAALADRFAVNRHTIRRAISALTERGLVRVERGRGMFVEDVVIDYPLTERTSFSANLLAQGRAPTSDTASIRTIKADRSVASALSLRKGALVICRESTGFADDTPISSSLTCFPRGRFPKLADHLEGTNSVSKALEASGVPDYRRHATRIFARMPTPSEAAALKQPVSQPVLVTEAIDVDRKGQPISYGVTCFAGARVQITVQPS